MEECSENIEEAKLTEIALFEHVFIVLGVIALTVSIGVGHYFTYKYISRNK